MKEEQQTHEKLALALYIAARNVSDPFCAAFNTLQIFSIYIIQTKGKI